MDAARRVPSALLVAAVEAISSSQPAFVRTGGLHATGPDRLRVAGDRGIPQIVVPGSRYTNVWNLLGLPAVVVPCGFSRDGLPVAIQIVGRPYDEATVLRIARAYERATAWHTRRPDPARWKLAS